MKVLFLPNFVGFDVRNQRNINAIFCGNYAARSVISANFKSHFPRNFHSFFIEMMLFARRKVIGFVSWVSAFCRTISHVCFLAAKKQMIRTNTSWVVALVANKKSVWNWSMGQFPRNSVRKTATSSSFFSNHSIAGFVSISCPDPATVRFFDFAPKSVCKWCEFAHREILPRRIFTSKF